MLSGEWAKGGGEEEPASRGWGLDTAMRLCRSSPSFRCIGCYSHDGIMNRASWKDTSRRM